TICLVTNLGQGISPLARQSARRPNPAPLTRSGKQASNTHQVNNRQMSNDDEFDDGPDLDPVQNPKSFWDKMSEKLFGEPREVRPRGGRGGRNGSRKTMYRNVEVRDRAQYDGMGRRGGYLDDDAYERPHQETRKGSGVSMPVLFIFLLIAAVCAVV